MSAEEPIRGNEGADIVGPRNADRERQNPFTVRPPASDHGTMPNLKWSFADSHIRIEEGGWARETTIEPGGLRELHWHPNSDEWQYYIEGEGRMTVFGSESKARTFDYRAGDVGYVPFAMGHYIENTGIGPLRFLEIFRSECYADLSLNQWLALTPRVLVEAHLKIDPEVVAGLSTAKGPVLPK